MLSSGVESEAVETIKLVYRAKDSWRIEAGLRVRGTRTGEYEAVVRIRVVCGCCMEGRAGDMCGLSGEVMGESKWCE